MIACKGKDSNTEISQNSYDSMTNKVDIRHLPCTCGHHNMTRHGFYTRKVKIFGLTILLKILRVRCLDCGKTHAVLPSSIVPWKSLALSVQIQILQNDHIEELMINDPDIDEQVITRINKVFKQKYKPWMKSLDLTFLSDLVSAAYHSFSSNFMQMHRGSYILFSLST